MFKYFFILFCCLFLNGVDAQRTYSQSRVVGNNIATNYYYDYLPGQPSRGRPYRQNGKIKYAPVQQPYYYNPYYYNNPYYNNYPPYSNPPPGGYYPGRYGRYY